MSTWKSRAWLLWLAVLAAAGSVAVILCTARGVRLTPDSAVYMNAARSLTAGRGLVVETGLAEGAPLTHFPPLLPVVLAAPAALGVDLLAAARWLDALMLAGSVLLVGWLVYRYTADRRLAVLGAMLAVSGLPMLRTYTALLSEPLFIPLVLLGILLMDIHLERPHVSLLLGSAAVFALAQLTRWTAAPFIGAAGLVLLLGGRGRATRRLWECALFALAALLPAILWVARNVALAGSAADRTLVSHPVTAAQAREALRTVVAWVAPVKLAHLLRMPYLVVASVILMGAVVWAGAGGYVLWRRTRTDGVQLLRESPWRPPYLLLVGGVAYPVFLAVSLSFFDASTTLKDRILVPMYLAGLVSALWLANLFVISLHSERARKQAMLGLCLLCVLVFVPRGALFALQRSRDGADYTSRAWRESPTLEAGLARASSAPIYTNDCQAFYLLGRVRAQSLPHKVFTTTRLPNRLYGEQSAAMAKDLRERGGLIVYFRGMGHSRGLPSEEQLVHELPLKLLQSFPDGAIYGIEPA